MGDFDIASGKFTLWGAILPILLTRLTVVPEHIARTARARPAPDTCEGHIALCIEFAVVDLFGLAATSNAPSEVGYLAQYSSLENVFVPVTSILVCVSERGIIKQRRQDYSAMGAPLALCSPSLCTFGPIEVVTPRHKSVKS